VNASRCFLLTLGALVVFSLGRALGLLGPAVLSVSILTAALLLVAWRTGATARDLGLGAGELGAGLRYGAAAFGLVLAGLVLAAVVPATSTFLHDSRAEIGGGQLAHEVGVSIILLTAIPEELAFRGVLLGSGLHLWGAWRASLVSSALFGLWHIEPTLRTMSDNSVIAGASSSVVGQALVVAGAVAVTFAAGLAFCWLRLRSGSLLAPLLAHVATNSLALVVAWFVVHRP
jgi:membrane protease YdiL (CAAX protease family)